MADRVLWKNDQKRLFQEWAKYEIRRAKDGRETLERRWRDYLTLYRAPMDRTLAQFPFEGAPNFTYPTARMSVDPVKSKYMTSIHATPNIWTLTPMNERWVDLVKPLQDFLQWIDQHQLNMWDVNQRVVGETLKLGTGIYKTGWRYERYRTTGYDPDLSRTRLVKELNQPTVDHVYLPNFLVPPETLSVDADDQGGAQWVAERFRIRKGKLKQQATSQAPFLPNYDPEATARVLNFTMPGPTEDEQRRAELDEVEPGIMMWDKPIELWEVWARFDTTGDGIEDDIVCIFHEQSMEILRATYNPFAHGKRPYQVLRYLRGDGFYGIGLCERAEMWQTVSSDLLNYDMARALLSNAPMYAVRDGANVSPNEPIFPGKMWMFPGDPREYIMPMFMSGGNPMDIRQLMGMIETAGRTDTGVTDLNSGMIGSVPSRTPATTVQALLQESNSRIDMSLKDARLGGLSKVGLQVLQNLQQQVANPKNNPDGSKYLSLAMMVLGHPEGEYTAQALGIPTERIELGVGVELTATSSVNNKELSKQNFMALMQIVEQRGPIILQMTQIASQSDGPMKEVAIGMLRAEQELLTRLYEQFDIRNPEELIPNVEQAISMAEAPQGGGDPLAALLGGQGGGGAPSPNGAPGMAGVQ